MVAAVMVSVFSAFVLLIIAIIFAVLTYKKISQGCDTDEWIWLIIIAIVCIVIAPSIAKDTCSEYERWKNTEVTGECPELESSLRISLYR